MLGPYSPRKQPPKGTPVRYFLLILTLMVNAGLVHAQGDAKLNKQWEAWKSAKEKAGKRMQQAFDRKIVDYKKNRQLPAETRNAHVTKLQEQKLEFVKSGELPQFDDMLPATIDYLDMLQTAAAPLQSNFERALEQAIGKGAEFDAIEELKEQWQSELPSRDELAGNSEFHGTRTFSDGVTIDFHFHVHQFENNTFGGHIWQDVHNVVGKAGWEYEAKLEGNQFLVTTRKMLHGTPRKLNFRGYIIGRRVVMTLTHKDDKPLTGDLVSIWKK